MNKTKNFKIFTLIFMMFFNILIMSFLFNSNKSSTLDNIEVFERREPTNLDVGAINPQNEITGIISDRSGKIFTNITHTSQFYYINRYNPGLDIQPNLFLQNWNITHARMFFENITVINYTKDIETQPTEFIISYSEIEPVYLYQKFAVETDLYINNVSIFIQDIVDEDSYTDENSWEVSIVNCSNDTLGTPNSLQTVGSLKRPHPSDMVAHWEVFDFKDSINGAIFLNTSNTNSTLINGIIKYWFAIKIKIPPNDGRTGGGPKFLYLNPDGSDPADIGEGETFAQSPRFINLTYNIDDVIETQITIGDYIGGDINSFSIYDEDRFFVNSTDSGKQMITYTARIELDNLTNIIYSWDDLKNLPMNSPFEWKNILNSIVFSMNFSLVTNISNTDTIKSAFLFIWNPDKLDWDIIYPFQINITQQYEFLQNYYITDPNEKYNIIRHLNTSANANNSLTFAFYYEGVDGVTVFNASTNLFNLEIGEIKTINTIQKYDPIVQDLHYANNITLLNGAFNISNDEIINSVMENDDQFLQVLGDSNSNNVSIDFKFNILENLDPSLWDVDDLNDWIFNLPNPSIYQIDFRISSNVSIPDPVNLTYAALEIYNGGNYAPFNSFNWLQFSDNKTFADIDENTKILPFDSYYSWYVMHLINVSDNHSLRVRLRFIGNGTFKGINVSIDEFTLNFHVQNAISSDVASKIGFGLNSNSLKPSDIHLKNFETNIPDNGLWEVNISDGIPTQGFYYFNVTSIWPEVYFDVSGNYTIEKSQNYNWDYLLSQNNPKILWNVSADIVYYSFYSNIDESRGLQFNVPSEWLLIEVYNSSSSPPTVSGGWYWMNQSDNIFKTITVYNISDGLWKIGMNSSMSILNMDYSATGEIKIDQAMIANASLPLYYGGEVNFEVYSESSSMIFSDYDILNETIFENSTYFEWNVLDTTLNTGKYYLKTYWVKYNQTHAFLSIDVAQINVSKWASNFTYDPLPETIRFGQEISLDLDFSCENSSISFEGFPVKFSIKYETLTQPFTKYIDINYETSLNYTVPDSFTGNLNITIEFDGDYRIDGYIEEFSLDIKEKLGVNIEFIITPDIQYLTGTYYFSVKVTDELGTPLESVELIFKLLDGQNIVVYEVATRSNEEGIASASLNLQNLGGGFTIQVSFAEKGIHASAEISSESLSVINEFTRFMESFIEYLPFIILGIAIISTFITVRYIMKSRKRRVWADDATVLDDLVKISYILIIDKEAGLSIYHKQISFEDIDSDLISGFLQAISAFKTEIKKSTTTTAKRPGFEMDYVDFKIVITDGEYVRVALVLEGTPSEKLKENQWLFTDQFEKRFAGVLQEFEGDITPFKQSDDLVEKYFNITLIYPLKLRKHYGVIKLKGLEKDLVEMAAEIQKERKVFFISSLLNLALAARKASRDEIISAILSLREKGLVVPVELD